MFGCLLEHKKSLWRKARGNIITVSKILLVSHKIVLISFQTRRSTYLRTVNLWLSIQQDRIIIETYYTMILSKMFFLQFYDIYFFLQVDFAYWFSYRLPIQSLIRIIGYKWINSILLTQFTFINQVMKLKSLHFYFKYLTSFNLN